MLGVGGCRQSTTLVARAEEGRECSNQLNPLNEQLIGGCLDRKLEEARRRRKWGRGEEMGGGGEGGGAKAEEGGEEGKEGGGEEEEEEGGGYEPILPTRPRAPVGPDSHTAGVYTEGPAEGASLPSPEATNGG